MSNKNQTKTNQPQLTGILGIIERTGNKIPHPIYMFIAFFYKKITGYHAILLFLFQIIILRIQKMLPDSPRSFFPHLSFLPLVFSPLPDQYSRALHSH